MHAIKQEVMMLAKDYLQEKLRKLKGAAADLETVLDRTNENFIDKDSPLYNLVNQYVEFIDKDLRIIQSAIERIKE